MAHLSENTSGVSKSSSDWLNYTGFPGDVCVTFFNVPPGNKDAVTPNPSRKKKAVEMNCDWLFDMSVKRPHGRSLANESCHLFQSFSRQSEGLAMRD